VAPAHVAFSLVLFFVVYATVFGAGFWYVLRTIRRGPIEVALPAAPTLGSRPLAGAAKEAAA
jgi:cytochrome bd-type quinol oxidase subunit 1